jgi:hypothetical protein
MLRPILTARASAQWLLTPIDEPRSPRASCRDDQPLPQAPLVHCLVEGAAVRVMATLAAYRFSRQTRGLWSGDVEKQLVRRLNAFADLEVRLWSMAAGPLRNGGVAAEEEAMPARELECVNERKSEADARRECVDAPGVRVGGRDGARGEENETENGRKQRSEPFAWGHRSHLHADFRLHGFSTSRRSLRRGCAISQKATASLARREVE